jgi:hypothetical protein
VRFVDGKCVGRNLVNLEPRIGGRYALKGFVFGTGKRVTPLRTDLLLLVGEGAYSKNETYNGK